MSYTQDQLDDMTLRARIDLASKGELCWTEVNRPEADAEREQREELAKPLTQRLQGNRMCRNGREQATRRLQRRNKERNSRKEFYEMMKEKGVDVLKSVTLPDFPALWVCA